MEKKFEKDRGRMTGERMGQRKRKGGMLRKRK